MNSPNDFAKEIEPYWLDPLIQYSLSLKRIESQSFIPWLISRTNIDLENLPRLQLINFAKSFILEQINFAALQYVKPYSYNDTSCPPDINIYLLESLIDKLLAALTSHKTSDRNSDLLQTVGIGFLDYIQILQSDIKLGIKPRAMNEYPRNAHNALHFLVHHIRMTPELITELAILINEIIPILFYIIEDKEENINENPDEER